MFEVGEFVQYGNSGVCRVKEIVTGVAGGPAEKRYYLLVPVSNTNGKIYTPVDNGKVAIRRILTAEEVRSLMQEIPKIESIQVQDERSRELCYKEALNSGSCRQWIGILKTLYERKRMRTSQGKKITSTDERYTKNVEDRLFGEFAVSLGKEKADVKSYVSELLSE